MRWDSFPGDTGANHQPFIVNCRIEPRIVDMHTETLQKKEKSAPLKPVTLSRDHTQEIASEEAGTTVGVPLFLIGASSATPPIQRQPLEEEEEMLVQKKPDGTVLQRTPDPGFDPAMISISGAEPTVSGSVTASLSAGVVVVVAPSVTARGDASLSLPEGTEFEDLSVGHRIEVGPTQSVIASHRIGVYTVGGKQGGEVTSAEHTKIGKPVRDAQIDPETEKVVPNVVAPWYSMPNHLNAKVSSVPLLFFDQPIQKFPLTRGRGTLSRIEGEGSYITSFAAKPAEGGLFHLKKFAWNVPWNTPINASGSGTGGTFLPSDTEEVPPTLDGPIAGQAAQTWVAFRTIDDAMRHSAAVLLRYLGPARMYDSAAHATIVMALRQKNPQITVTVTPRVTDSPMYDDITITASSHTGTVTSDLGNLGKDEAGTMTFGLNDVIDPDDITDVTSIHLQIVKSRTFGDTRAGVQIFYPFASGGMTTAVGEGRYRISWTLA